MTEPVKSVARDLVIVAARDGLIIVATRDGLIIVATRDGLIIVATRDGIRAMVMAFAAPPPSRPRRSGVVDVASSGTCGQLRRFVKTCYRAPYAGRK